MKKIIKFLDNHRLILILIILLLISLAFLGIKSLIFLNHNFTPLTCTQDLDETYCYHYNEQIYQNPKKQKEEIFKNYAKEIKDLKSKYDLPKFNFFTSYYYETAAIMHFVETGKLEELATFFINYNRTYNIKDFYKKNVLYFDLYYHYKIA